MMTLTAASVAAAPSWSVFPRNSARPSLRTRRRVPRPIFDSPSAAIAALVDNARDARARRVDVLIDEYGDDVRALAVLDDGVGMVPEMVRAACAPGAMCRLGDGPHFARAGLGLPSAPFAVGDRFALLSRVADGPYAGVGVEKAVIGPVAPAGAWDPPAFVEAHLETARFSGCRTIVVIEPQSDLGPAASFCARLRSDLGFIFEALADQLVLSVNGAPVLGRTEFPRQGPGAELFTPFGPVSLRSAFRSSPRGRRQPSAANPHRSGLIAGRLRRRFGPVRGNPLWRTLDEDRRWRIDLDFTPEADDVCRPSRRLDAVDLDPKVWTYLADQGLQTVVERLRDASS